ncbi:CopG family ribbon-helix-helix protein [Rhodovibrio salinarum]|nr:ribbon-helix-helix domain-containing protein [Rhodovibrio salinarum]
MATRTFTAHVPDELADKVDRIAERRERSRGWVIKQALAAWVADEEERHRLTQEALADADAGRVTEHARVQDWAQRLSAANLGDTGQ